EMIRSMAMAIAEAQFALDRSSLMVAEFMSGKYPLRSLETGALVDADGKPTSAPVLVDSRVQFGHTFVDGKRVANQVSLMELGFVPNFYQFVDTVIEVKLALKVNRVSQTIDPTTGAVASSGPNGLPGRSNGFVVSSTPVDAAYASSFGFSLELAS